MSTFAGWEAAVLAAIGAPQTPNNVAFLDSWANLEGGTAAYNPLNTTLPAAGSSAYNGVGVQSYTSPQQGVASTAQTLLNGNYPNLVAALRSGNPFGSSAIANDLSTWSGGGYSSVPVPAGLTTTSQGSTVGASTPGGSLNIGGVTIGPWENVPDPSTLGGQALTGLAPLTNAITSAAQNAGLLAIALAFIAGGFAWLAAPTIKEYAPKVAEAAAA